MTRGKSLHQPRMDQDSDWLRELFYDGRASEQFIIVLIQDGNAAESGSPHRTSKALDAKSPARRVIALCKKVGSSTGSACSYPSAAWRTPRARLILRTAGLSQLLMIVQIFIVQSEPVLPLRNHRQDGVLNAILLSPVQETA